MQLKTMDTECRKQTKVEKYVLPPVYRVAFILKKEINRYKERNKQEKRTKEINKVF